MATIRVEKRKDFTVLSNACLDDERLSLRAVGLLNYMLRQPDDWNFTLEWLAGKHKDGLCAIRSAMEELEAAGYVTRGQSRQGGKFSKNEYIVRESPEAYPPAAAAAAPFRQGGLDGRAVEDAGPYGRDGNPPSCENRITAPPSCDFPITEKPITENRTLPNTKRQSINPPKPPRGRRAKAACEWEPELFERFWKLYPRGEDKDKARYEWDILKPDLALMQTMSAALKRQIESDEWRRGVGIPYACRWLSNRRWEAAEKAAPVSGSNTGEEALPWI